MAKRKRAGYKIRKKPQELRSSARADKDNAFKIVQIQKINPLKFGCRQHPFLFRFPVGKTESNCIRNQAGPLFSCERGPLAKCPTGTLCNSPPKMRLSGGSVPLSAESSQRELCPFGNPTTFYKRWTKILWSRANLCDETFCPRGQVTPRSCRGSRSAAQCPGLRGPSWSSPFPWRIRCNPVFPR